MHDIAIKEVVHAVNDVNMMPNQCKLLLAYIDLLATQSTKLLCETLKHALPLWCAVSANKLVLNRITNGMHFPLTCAPIPFQ